MATTDVERLVVSLEASITKFERTMARANGAANASARKIESRFATMNRRLETGFLGLQRGIAGAFATAAAAQGAVRLIDSATRIENSLKVAGLAGEELERVYDRLRDSALRNAAPLESLVTLYGRIVLVQNELGVSGERVEGLVNTIALALRASGQSSQEASGALLQLSQALGSGVVRAEEFNSILEGAPTILQAAASGIIEAEGSVAKLRQIMLDGNLSSKAFFAGIEAGAYVLEEKVANSALTVSQAMENLQTRLIDVARDFDDGAGASAAMADGITNLGDGIADLAVFLDNIVGPLQNFIAGMNEGIAAARGLANEISRITGLERFGFDAAVAANNLTGGAGLSVGSYAASRVIEQTFSLIGQTPQDEALARALAGERPPEPVQIPVTAGPAPISIGDPQYRATSASGSGGGSGGGGSKQSPAQRYADDVAQMERRIAALQRETQLQRGLNPLVNDYGLAIERLRAQMELENAATEAGLELTPERIAQIEHLASAYGMATAEAGRLAEMQEATVAQFEELRDAARSALETIVDGFLEGKDAGDIFSDVLKNIGSQLLSMGMNGLFGGGSTAGFGAVGKFLGFASGTANTGGRRGEVRGVVHGQEAVIPLPTGGKVPVDLRLPSLPQMSQASGPLTVHVQVDGANGDQHVIDLVHQGVAAGLRQYDTKLKPRVQGIMAQTRQSGPLGLRG